jgi:hypothetical protein
MATAEIVDLQGTVDYLNTLVTNISHAVASEMEVLRAGFARVGLTDAQVLDPVAAGVDALTAASGQFAAAVGRLLTAHLNISEAVSAAGQDGVARDAEYYKAH